MPNGIQVNLKGRRIGRLRVLEYAGKKVPYISMWKCICDCGTIKNISVMNLNSGNTTSCGCVHGVVISKPITRDQLRKLVRYDPKTGYFTAKVTGRNCPAGKRLGGVDIQLGYRQIVLGGARYREHVLAWFYMTGEWPTLLDHKNGIKSDNSWKNLRLATQTQQNANRNVRKDNVVGYKGVRERRGRFIAYIGRGEVLGYFSSAPEAARVYDIAAKKRYGEFARTNFGSL